MQLQAISQQLCPLRHISFARWPELVATPVRDTTGVLFTQMGMELGRLTMGTHSRRTQCAVPLALISVLPIRDLETTSKKHLLQ